MAEPDPLPPGPGPSQPTSHTPTHHPNRSSRGRGGQRNRQPQDGQRYHGQNSVVVDALTNPESNRRGPPPDGHARGGPPRRGRGRGRPNDGAKNNGRTHTLHSGETPNYAASNVSVPGAESGMRRPHGRRDRPPNQQPAEASNAGSQENSEAEKSAAKGAQAIPPHRRRQFGAKLTAASNGPSNAGEEKAATVPATPSKDLDLTSRLIESFSRSASGDDAPDCPICFNTISAGSPTWSCSPEPVGSAYADPIHVEAGASSCCWTTFHLKCIKAWATKSVQATHDAYVARNVFDRSGDWRCPGCQTKRSFVPVDYRCFCGRVVDPKPGRLATLHSCGEGCDRRREACDHPCPLSCHPGPCPPCNLTVTQECHCGRQTISTRCSTLTGQTSEASLSCGRVCNKPLNCGLHSCSRQCHPGPCYDCDVQLQAKCYCGRETKPMLCGEGDPIPCESGDGNWLGLWECGRLCEEPFDCGIHKCPKTCHPPSSAASICPFSPSEITTCPCANRTPLSTLSEPPRTACTDPIPTCGKVCSKVHSACGHVCQAPCHTGDCPPCTVKVEERCRCGREGRTKLCWDIQAGKARAVMGEDEEDRDDITGAFMCTTKCRAFKSCGSHYCNRICCPLAALAGIGDTGKGKKKQKHVPTPAELAALDPEGWHSCDLVCGKPLPCGNHTCMERDHRGPCPTCLQSSYEELICRCGRTIVEPPVPCGTIIQCPYPCNRPPPQCGHPKVPHSCHEDPEPCPPCVHLTERQCVCGKKQIPNVRCNQAKVQCGLKCGKTLECGYHACDVICHSGPCAPCTQVCGKARKSCLPLIHPCTKLCHAPSACPENEPCAAPITLQCACGRQKQPAVCGKTLANASAPPRVLPCMQECQVAKRNERLAAALGITTNEDGKASAMASSETKYAEHLVQFWKANATFAASVEKSLNDFVTSEKRLVVLHPMPLPRRKFVRDLAEVYRLDAEDVDQEPKRSVQLRRRLDTRIPRTLLSSATTPSRSSTPASTAKGGAATVSAWSSGGSLKSAWGQRPPSQVPTPNRWAAVAAASRPQAERSADAWRDGVVNSGPSVLYAAPAPQSSRPAVAVTDEVPDSWDETDL